MLFFAVVNGDLWWMIEIHISFLFVLVVSRMHVRVTLLFRCGEGSERECEVSIFCIFIMGESL